MVLVTQEGDRTDLASDPTSLPRKPLTKPVIEQKKKPIIEKKSLKLPGQQSIKSYFKYTKRQENVEELDISYSNDDIQDRMLQTSDTVTSAESRQKLILLGSDVVGLFPAMKEVKTGTAVASQVRKSESYSNQRS